MKNLRSLFYVVAACIALGALGHVVLAQQPPGAAGEHEHQAPVEPGQGNDALLKTIRAQTEAINTLSARVDKLEAKVTALEKAGTH
jgi:hypothetical protein